jgi:muramidase (phage lysozyme)
MPNPSNKVKTESIDEVILSLLGLSSNEELHIQTYFKKLKNKLISSELVGSKINQDERILLSEELKRIKKIKDQGYRFKIKSVKSKDILSNKISQDLRRKKITSSSAIVRYKGGPLAKRDEFVPQKTEDREDATTSLSPIRKTLNYILEILSAKFKFEKKQSDLDRKEKETEKRGKGESTLEGFKKGLGDMAALTKKVMSPFQNIIDRIKKFLFFTLLGRAFNSFMNWMNDKENQKKFNALVEFLSDHWPAIAGIYILFGTSFGKLIRGILKGAVRMTVALAMNIPKIIGFIKKNKNLAKIALIASPFVTREVAKIFSDKKNESPEKGLIPKTNSDLESAKKDTDKARESRVPTFNLGGLIPSFKMGGMKPFGMGMDFSSGVPISGAGQDDTLIAAKTGEAILTEKDQSDLSQRFIDRNTGEALNIPQYLSGRKPGTVAMSNLRFPGFGGGFFKGGMISGFKDGGMVGGGSSQTKGRRIEELEMPHNYPRNGLIGNAMNFLGGMFNFGKGNTPSKPSPRTRPKMPLQEYQNPEALSLLKTIRSAEHYGGTNPYQALYGGKSAPVTKMTIQEVIDMGNTGRLPKRFGGQSAGYGSGSAATGAYQFMPFTLQDLIRRGKAKPNEIMSQSVQDRLGWELAKNRGVTLSSLKRTGLSQSVMDMMAPEWASFPYSVAGGKSYYGQPVKGADFLQQIYSQSLGSLRTPKKQRGGFVGENMGRDIPGATADRQLIAAQPGEFVLPKATVSRLGVPIIEKIVAMTDSNSIAYRQSENRRIPSITPYSSSSSRNVMTLPPIVQGTGSNRARASGYSGGTRVPSFSHISEQSDRNMIASLYGIETSTGMG